MINSDPKDYWERRLTENFDLHGTGYITLGRNYNRWLYKVRKYIFSKEIKSLGINSRNIDVLDVGSGTGFYIKLWKEMGIKSVCGLDITNVAVENLRRQYPSDKFYVTDIGEKDVGDLQKRKFDVISAFDVLFHIVDDSKYETAINNINKLLKKDGLFIFSDNFIHRSTTRSQNQASRPLEAIEKILSQNGFTIIKRRPMFVIMNAPVDTNRSELRSLWTYVITRPIRSSEKTGLVIGGILYPFELMLLSFVRESPTTEMMICKKV